MAGRPTKLTPERQARICEVLKCGGTWEAAAAYAGLDVSTVHRWRERGETGENPYRDFRDACTRAEAEGEALAVKAVFDSFTTAENLDPTMALRWLERRRPKGWSPTNITKHIGAVPVDVPREVRVTLVEPAKVVESAPELATQPSSQPSSDSPKPTGEEQ